MFTNPLDNISVASPCPADWNEMFGDERKRFCAECKLNVYNLSGMTRREAENLLINSEGRLCVRYFKRADGTVLTADCPVGWANLKRRVSIVAAAVASIVFGFASGLMGICATETFISLLPTGDIPTPESGWESKEIVPIVGEAIPEGITTQGQILSPIVVGRVEKVEDLRKKKVVAWIK